MSDVVGVDRTAAEVVASMGQRIKQRGPVDERIAALEQAGLRRVVRHRERPWSHRGLVEVSSNDYLGLADDPRVKVGAIEAVEHLGCSARASRLMAGDLELCEQLEADLAALVGTEAALVFGSGFLTNLGVMGAVAGRGDEIFADRLNHSRRFPFSES